MPAISVVMSVYNGEEHLSESIESILHQNFSNFEFVIINDGSSDNSGKLIEKYAAADKRIVTIHQSNMGLAKSLNKAISIASGKYIARQDADDVSLLGRLSQQIEFFSHNKDNVLCGTWFEEVNENKGKKLRKYPVTDSLLRKNIKYYNQFCHPSVMFRKDAFMLSGQYDERLSTGQDFELWMRLSNFGHIANIPEILVKKRIGFGQTISWEKRKDKILLWTLIFEKHFSSDVRKVNPFKFLIYYIPLLLYGYIPVPLLKMLRTFRYKK